MAKKFYWLKLKMDFFKRHDMMIIENMPNGKDYVLFYLKLLVESISHEGMLRFSDTIPYNEQMLSTITNTNVDIVRSAIKIFTELNLMELLDDGTIYLNEVQNMTGSETEWAKKKRDYRLMKSEQGLLVDNSKTFEDNVRQEIELEIELEKETNNNATNIFFHWNENKIGIVHQKLTTDMTKAIDAKIKKYDFETIKKAISRLCKAVHDPNYFYDTRWNLKNFMQQKNGLPNWLDEGQIWNDYCTKKKTIENNQSSNQVSEDAKEAAKKFIESRG